MTSSGSSTETVPLVVLVVMTEASVLGPLHASLRFSALLTVGTLVKGSYVIGHLDSKKAGCEDNEFPLRGMIRNHKSLR